MTEYVGVFISQQEADCVVFLSFKISCFNKDRNSVFTFDVVASFLLF